MKIGDRWISLNALHTFEAAARHGHMGQAARELNVTQSAVSHQVRTLEDALGVSLFERHGRRIEITPAGARFMSAIQTGFDGISAAALSLQQDAFSGVLTIMSPVSFLNEWLAAKLADFLTVFPNLSLRCVPMERGRTTIPSEIDVAIAFNTYEFSGRVVAPLLEIDVFPVCAPRLVAGPYPLNPTIIERHTLIHEDNGDVWSRWFAGAGIAPLTPRRHIYAGSLHDAMAFARKGAGFALSDRVLGQEDVTSGTLVQPFGPNALKLSGYYLATRINEPESSAASAFTRWLKREVSKTDMTP